MPSDTPGGYAHPQMQENCPAADVFEYTLSTGDVPLTELGGRCRVIEVLVGSGGTLVVQTIGSNGTDRTLTHVTAPYTFQPTQFTLIRGSSNGSTSGLVLRCYK